MQVVDDYRAWLERRGRGRSADKYCQIARRWLEDPETLEKKIASRRHAPAYRRNLVAAVRSFSKFTGDDDTIARLDDLRLPPPTPRDQREPLDRDEWAAVLAEIRAAAYLTEPLRGTLLIIATRGIRCGDVLRLQRRAVSRALKEGTLSFESKGERWQHFSAAPVRGALEILDGLFWGSAVRLANLVCPRSDDDRALSSAGAAVRRMLDRVAVELDMEPAELYAHRFRHTYATRFLQQMAGDPEAVFKLQTQMGWAQLNTAANYLRRSRRDELDEVERGMFAELET